MKKLLIFLPITLLFASLHAEEDPVTSNSFGYLKTGLSAENNVFNKERYPYPAALVGIGKRTSSHHLGLDSSISIKAFPFMIGVNLSEMLLFYPSSIKKNPLFFGAGAEGEVYYVYDIGISPFIGFAKAAVGFEFDKQFIQFEVAKPVVIQQVDRKHIDPDYSWTRLQITYGF